LQLQAGSTCERSAARSKAASRVAAVTRAIQTPGLDVTEARAECGGEKRRAHAVSGEVGYAIAGLWVRYPFL